MREGTCKVFVGFINNFTNGEKLTKSDIVKVFQALGNGLRG